MSEWHFCLSNQVFTPNGSIVDGEIVDHKNGTYEFVYVVPKEGDFSLALRLYDQHIKGSPFKLTVSRVAEAEVEVGGACVGGACTEQHLDHQTASCLNKSRCSLDHNNNNTGFHKLLTNQQKRPTCPLLPPSLSLGVPLHHHGDQLCGLCHHVHGLL